MQQGLAAGYGWIIHPSNNSSRERAGASFNASGGSHPGPISIPTTAAAWPIVSATVYSVMGTF